MQKDKARVTIVIIISNHVQISRPKFRVMYHIIHHEMFFLLFHKYTVYNNKYCSTIIRFV